MTPEERLAKTEERLDAIARNLELLSSLQIDTERRLAQLVEVTNNIGTATQDLIVLMHSHDQRIAALEAK